MANIIGIVDPDPGRRRRFIEAVKPRLAPFRWLKSSEMDAGDVAIAWAAIPSAPVSTSLSSGECSGFVLGDMESNWEGERSNSEYILRLMDERGDAAIAGEYGFYLACRRSPAGIVLGADFLGLFPLYYYATPQFMMFSTAYSLFRQHPLYSREISSRGLAGIFLTMHITGGHTLIKNVRRLPAGCALKWTEGRGAVEMPAGSLKPSSELFGDTYQEHLDRLDESLKKALTKRAQHQKALLLSGGLDSRILAGYLGEMPVQDPIAVAIGDRTDNDVRFAKKVARKIRWPYKRVDVDYSRFPEFARKLVELEQVSNGFTDLAFFQCVEDLNRLSPYITTGFAGDLVMGGSHIRAGFDKARHEYSFESKFRHINRYGFSPDQIRQLVHPEFLGESLETALDDLRNAYASIDALPYQRSSIFDIYHRVRFHTAASIVWRLSFAAWPSMPYVSKEVLEAALAMPAASLMERRAQIDLLCRRFPLLAALPLERQTFLTTPPLAGYHRRILSSLKQKSGFEYRKRRAMKILRIPNWESRFYFRTFDVNNAGWQAVREEAEQHRAKAEKILDPRMLKQLLPPPDVPVDAPSVTVDSSGRKLLLAFMIWAGENL